MLNSEDRTTEFHAVRIPEGCSLQRKTSYEYTTPNQMYKVEVFEHQDGTCYAIGVPVDGPVIVYGSNVVKSVQQALQTVVDKIEREGVHFTDHTTEP